MVQALHYFKESASQTAGPYVHIGLAPAAAGFDIYKTELGHDIAGPNADGTHITVTGTVYDGTGAPVKDELIEVWQANANGIYPGRGEVEDGFCGWGRVIPDFETGVFSFHTVKPGVVTGRGGRPMAPHLNLWLVARGINIGLNTRMYFGDEATANATDPVLGLIEQTARRNTLIARAEGTTYHFDICLQGDDETVFFDV
jgi:protocatechuate 3,4-dioxygenase, alpha subunit